MRAEAAGQRESDVSAEFGRIPAQAIHSPTMPDFLTPQFITSVLVIVLIVHIILGACAYLIMLERKLSAWIQDRVGPNRVGPAGLLQPLADGLKFILKEEFFPRGADRVLFLLAPGLIIIPALIGFAIIPWGGVLDTSSLPFADQLGIGGHQVKIIGADVNVGIIYLLAVASVGVYGVVLGGWASNSKYSFFGALRASAQMISYEIPMGVALLAVVVYAGSIIPFELVQKQLDGQWYLIHHPIAAIIFYTCMLAENNRAPFDMAEAESELVGGYHTEYSSMKFALFFLAEYAHMITGSAFFVVLFLGGWSVNPFGTFLFEMPVEGGILLILAQFSIVAFKIFLVICLTMALRWTLPRFRFDQLMRLAWEGMIPASLVLLLVTSFAVFMQGQNWGWMWAVSIVTAIFLVWITPLMPKSNVNKRIPMIGSRFNPLREEAVVTSPTDPMALEESGLGDAATGTVSMH